MLLMHIMLGSSDHQSPGAGNVSSAIKKTYLGCTWYCFAKDLYLVGQPKHGTFEQDYLP
jgi:hypothetical protein